MFVRHTLGDFGRFVAPLFVAVFVAVFGLSAGAVGQPTVPIFPPARGASIQLVAASLSAAKPSRVGIGLRWADNISGETGFKIERSPVARTPVWTQIYQGTQPNQTTYVDATAAPGVAYGYRVRAYLKGRRGGDGPYSNIAVATYAPPPVTPPLPPQPPLARVSLSSAGAQGSGDSIQYMLGNALSGDGRYVAFDSLAPDMVADDTNDTRDVFVRDTVGATTQRASVATGGAQSVGLYGSNGGTLSADGRTMTFGSSASNFSPGAPMFFGAIYLRDLQSGTTTLVSVGAGGAVANGSSAFPFISGDGRFVAFTSSANNLVAGDTNNARDVFVRDLQTGVTERVNVTNTGRQTDDPFGNSNLDIGLAISADGRYVMFASGSSDLVPGDFNNVRDMFVRDRQNATTTRVNLNANGSPRNVETFNPALSADGRVLCFEENGTTWVRNLSTGTLRSFPGGNASLSGDGRFLVYDAKGPTIGGPNVGNVWVADLQSGQKMRLDRNSAGAPGDGDSSLARISADGRKIIFTSAATNLVPGDTNGALDVFSCPNPFAP